MNSKLTAFAVTAALLAVGLAGPAAAQKQGGILRVHVIDSSAERVDARGSCSRTGASR